MDRLTYVSPEIKPLYYRFVMKGSDGSVLLAHNHETHPARVRTHADLAREANEPGVVHGYAYRIGGGWRLHDYEHKPLTDPFVKAQVARAITRREGTAVPEPEEPSYAGADFDRQHHGLPLTR